MIEVKHYGSGERTRVYECTQKREIELCLANIECLLNIALLDSDEHIKKMGGEQELLNLMNRYLDLAYRLMGIMVESQFESCAEREPRTGHCKDCKYFEYNSVAKVDGIPLIVAHEICSRWGNGCKTKEDGYCFLFEPQGSEG